jgi:hypothetical protein
MEIDRKSVHASPERLQRSARDTDKAFYNNRILEFAETEIAGPLRASGGEFGGSETIIVSHYCEAIGFDSYNLSVTGSVAITLQASRADDHHLPIVFRRHR